MLFFETWLCTVKREWPKSGFKSTYVTIHTNIEIDIQPDLWQVLGLDKVKDSYKAFITTNDTITNSPIGIFIPISFWQAARKTENATTAIAIHILRNAM